VPLSELEERFGRVNVTQTEVRQAKAASSFSGTEKVAILKRHLVEKVAMSALCEQHELLPTQIYNWLKEFFENGHAAFDNGRASKAVENTKDQRSRNLKPSSNARIPCSPNVEIILQRTSELFPETNTWRWLSRNSALRASKIKFPSKLLFTFTPLRATFFTASCSQAKLVLECPKMSANVPPSKIAFVPARCQKCENPVADVYTSVQNRDSSQKGLFSNHLRRNTTPVPRPEVSRNVHFYPRKQEIVFGNRKRDFVFAPLGGHEHTTDSQRLCLEFKPFAENHPMDEREKKLVAAGYPLERGPKEGTVIDLLSILGETVYASGQVPFDDGVLTSKGKVPSQVSVEEATKAASLCAANILRAIITKLGSLDRIARVVRVTGYVNADPSFEDCHLVINGATNLLKEVFGPEAGRHARTALGMGQLPLGTSVEVEAIFQLAR